MKLLSYHGNGEKQIIFKNKFRKIKQTGKREENFRRKSKPSSLHIYKYEIKTEKKSKSVTKIVRTDLEQV